MGVKIASAIHDEVISARMGSQPATAGAVLAHYRLEARLGQGGMAVVWKATDLQLGREVALKLLPAEHIHDVAWAARFLREARCASALNHPNIVTIYEANTAADIPFIAMELVRGVTLSQRIREQPLGVVQSVDVARQICSALQHAHAAGIVHRDLKPSNVMLTGDGAVKVLDFGIAKRDASTAGVGDATVTSLTAVGTTIGTVAYMSPEQALGDEVDARSDIFSLGIVLYEMLAGIRPFGGTSSVAISRALVHSDPKPLREWSPEAPVALEKVVERCLAKDREHRYQNASDVAQALSLVLRSIEKTAEQVTDTIVAGRFARRSFPARTRSIGAAGALVAIALSAGAWHLSRQEGPRSSAAREADNPTVYSTEYDAWRAARGYLDRYDRKGSIDRAVEALEVATRLNPEYALAYAGMSEAYLRRHIVTPDQQWVKAAMDSATMAVSLNPDLAAAHTALGSVLSEQGDHKSAANSFRTAITLDPSHGRAYLGLAKAAARTGGMAEAEPLFEKAIALSPGDWIPLTEYGIALYRNARYKEAAERWEKARGFAPDNARVLRNLGGVYHVLDRHDDAASALQRALEIEPTAQVYANLGTLRYFQGRYVDAAGAFEQAVARGGAGLFLYWGNLGDAYRWVPGRRDKSLEAYRHAIELVRERLNSTPDDPELLSSLAAYLAKSGDSEGALKQAAALDRLGKRTAGSFFKTALACEIAGNRELALTSLASAVRTGYPVREIQNEPELTALRADARFREIMARNGSGNR